MKLDPYCKQHGCPCSPECSEECYLEACGGDEPASAGHDEDEYLDDPRRGLARELNRKYQ